MSYETARNLLKELSLTWIWEAGKYNRKIPDYLLSETLSHYYQACDVVGSSGRIGDPERIAIARMQLHDIWDIEGEKEFSRLLEQGLT